MIKAQNEKQVMEALVSPQGKVITEFLDSCLADKMAKLTVADGHEIYRTQGAVQELNEIIDLATNALKVLHY